MKSKLKFPAKNLSASLKGYYDVSDIHSTFSGIPLQRRAVIDGNLGICLGCLDSLLHKVCLFVVSYT
jgi:hypothetical protein